MRVMSLLGLRLGGFCAAGGLQNQRTKQGAGGAASMWELIDVCVTSGDELQGRAAEDPAHPRGAGSRNPASATRSSGAVRGCINVG